MKRINNKFKELKTQNKKAFIAYICAGDPDINTTHNLVLTLDRCGADIIELGVPFSDPLADGPTIQAASQRALKKHVNLPKIFSLIKKIRRKSQVPIVLMGYYNPILIYGLKKLVQYALISGADWAIIPDLPVEEANYLIRECKGKKFASIFLISPASSKNKMKEFARKSKSFIYYVS